MTTCGSCGRDVPATARFCPDCGTPVSAVACSGCGEELLPGARFCMTCGTPAVAPGQVETMAPIASRRVTSVLFGDLVGFTTLSEARDQEDVRELLSRYFEECRQVIGRYGGTVEKFIGDAVMAVWGVPVAHEDDAERAVRAGLELVALVAALGDEVGVPGLALRVGIVTGEVAVTIGATNQGMVAGDAVNTAARVQTAAAPGQVWVDETTRLLTTAAISYADAGSHRLKGKADPMPLWTVRAVVAAVGGAQRADGLEAPLVGRDRELRLVKELFHRVEESGQPSLLVVDGDAGVGKSRLGWEFEKYVDGLTSGVWWHSGRCVAYGEGVAFFALAEALRGRLRVVSDESQVEEAVLLERGLEQHVPDPSEREWLRPRVGALLGIGSVGTFPREDLFAAWVTFLERVGKGDPVTLVIDDAQHADEGLVLFLEHLLSVASFGCFVVLLTRPGLLEAKPSLATNRRATVIHLPTLSDRDVEMMLDGLVAGLPVTARDQLVQRSEGLPLFAVETVRSLIDRDLVVPRAGQYVLADPDSLDLDAIAAPASLQALVAARLDTLNTDQRRLVDRASVLGGVFTTPAITALCDDLPAPAEVLDQLVRLQILGRESSRISAEFGQYRFVQSVVRQVAYGTLSRHDRKAVHLAVVAQFEAEGDDADDTAAIRAQHYLDALEAVPGAGDVPALQAAALANLRRAAARARALGSPGESARHLLSAVRLTEQSALKATIWRDLAQAECDAGLWDDAIEHAETAESLSVAAGERMDAGHAAAVRALSLSNGHGDNEQAIAVAEPWWEELKGEPDTTGALLALAASLTIGKGRMGGEVPHGLVEARMQLAERLGETGELADSYNFLSIYYGDLGLRGLSELLLHSAADLARTHHQPRELARALVNLAAMYMVDDLACAEEFARESVQATRATGLVFFGRIARANLSVCLWHGGRWDELQTLLPAGEDAGFGDRMLASFVDLSALACGRPLTGPAYSADDAGDDLSERSWVAFHQAIRADSHVDLGEAARLGVEAARGLFKISGLTDDLVHVWPTTVALAMRADDQEALDTLLAMIDEHPETQIPLGLAAHRAHVAGLLAMRDGGDPVSTEAALRTAIAGFDTWGAPPARARAQGDLSRLLRELGRFDEAGALLAAAREVLEPLGAHAWLAELEPSTSTS